MSRIPHLKSILGSATSAKLPRPSRPRGKRGRKARLDLLPLEGRCLLATGLINPSFEGSLSGWTLAQGGVGSATNSLGGVVLPTHGSSFAVLTTAGTTSTASQGGTAGTLLSQQFSVPANGPLTLRYNFLTSEGTPSYYNDFARGELLNSGGTVVATLFSTNTNSSFVDASGSGYSRQTGWGTASFTVAAAGTYSLRFVVSDFGDTSVDSALALDQIIVPSVSLPDLAPSSDTGILHSDGLTSLTTLTFTGTGETGNRVELGYYSYADQIYHVGNSAIPDAAGAWSITQSGLSEGFYGFYANASEAYGGYTTRPSYRYVTIDTTAPTAVVNGPFAVNEGASISIGGSGADSNGAVSFAWDLNNDGIFETSGAQAAFSAAGIDGPATRPIAFRVTDAAGNIKTLNPTIAINNVDPTATPTGTLSVIEGSTVIVGLTSPVDPSAADVSAGFHYSFATTSGALATTYAGAGFATSAAFTFADNGSYTVYGRIFDKDGGFTTYSTTVNVANVAPTATLVVPATALEGSPFTVALTNAADVSTTDSAAGFEYSFDLGTGYGAWSTANSVSLTPPDDGTYPIKARVRDKDGGVREYSANVVVSNVAPTLTMTGVSSVSEGSTYTLALSASDPGADTLSSWTINWGDGSAPQTIAGNTQSVAHIYTDGPRNFTILATATDEDGTYTVRALGSNAQASLDPSFGGSGEVIQNLDGFTADYIHALTGVQPDGKILVAGHTTGGNDNIALARYNPNGSPDLTFGTNGTVVTEFGGYESAESLVVDGSGNILVAGNFGLARYTPSGALDTAFGNGGRITSLSSLRKVLLDGNGNILVSSGSYLARYTPDGAFDLTFGSNGITPYLGYYANDIDLTPDGRLVTIESRYNGNVANRYAIVVRRYLPNGQLDSNFGQAGLALINNGGFSDQATKVTIQQGKILVGGFSEQYEVSPTNTSQFNLTRRDLLLVRLKADGTSLDGEFGTNGIVSYRYDAANGNNYDYFYGMGVDPSGRIVVSGSYGLYRFSAIGQNDSTFGSGGVASRLVSTYSTNNPVSFGGGKIYYGGYSYDGTQGANFAVQRLLDDGTADSTFNGGTTTSVGVIQTSFQGPLADYLRQVTVRQSDGKILAIGYSQGGTTEVIIARYLADGQLDTTFAGGGISRTGISGSVTAAVVAPDGAILVSTGYDLYRVKPDGTLDTANYANGFSQGQRYLDGTYVRTLKIDSSNRLLVGGYRYQPFRNPDGSLDYNRYSYDFAVSRYSLTGVADTTYGVAGVASFDLGTTTTVRSDQILNAIDVDAAGRVVAVGQTRDYNQATNQYLSFNALVVRFTATGQIDGTFNPSGNGILLTTGADGSTSPQLVAVDSSGRVLVGYSYSLQRYTTSGNLDSSFSDDGIIQNYSQSVGVIRLDNLGRIIVAGSGSIGRYRDDGTPDTTFGPSGFISIPNRQVASLDVDSANRILVAGYVPSLGATGVDYWLARFITDGLAVTVNNVAPQNLAIAGPATANEGTSLTLTASATDPAGANDPLTYTWNITRNGSTYLQISGASISFNVTDNGNYVATVTVNDGDGGVVSTSKLIVVANVAPAATFQFPLTGVEGTAFTLSLVNPSDASPVDASAGFTYAFDFGGGYGSFGASNTATFTPTDSGTRAVRAIIRDKDGGLTEYTGSVVVANVKPVSTIQGTTSGQEGTAIALGSTVTDVSSVDQAAGFSYAWSVLRSRDGGATWQAYASGTSTGYNFTPNDDGTYRVTLVATDKDGAASDPASLDIAVANVAPTATIGNSGPVNEGSPVTVSLTAASDPGSIDASSLHYSFATTSGALATTYAGATDGASKVFTFADNGTNLVYGRIFDKDGGFKDAQTTVVVNNVAPTPTFTVNAPQSSLEGTKITVAGAATDPSSVDTSAGLTLTWTATKNGVSYATASGASFSFTPDDNGTYVVALKATDKDGGNTSTSQTVVVTNVTPTLSQITAPSQINEGQSATLAGQVFDPGTLDSPTVTVSWGDGTIETLTLTSAANADVPGGIYGISSATDSLYKIDPTTGIATLLRSIPGRNFGFAGATFLNGTLYVSDAFAVQGSGGDARGFGTIDLATGAYTAIGNQGNSSNWWGIAGDDADGLIYSIDDANAGSKDIFPFYSVTPTGLLTKIAANVDSSIYQGFADLAYDNVSGKLYGAGQDGYLYTINRLNGAKTQIGYMGVGNGGLMGMTYDATSHTLYLTQTFNQPGFLAGPSKLYRLNTTTGAATLVGATGVDTIDALAWLDGGSAALAGVFSKAHTYGDNGSYSVTLTGTDKDGAATVITRTITVVNVAPTATLQAPATADEGTAFTLSLTNAADASPVDTAAGFTYAFDFGDGYGAWSSSASASFTPPDDGVRVVKAKIRDKDGGVTEYTRTVSVENVNPVAANATASTSEDTPTTVDVLALASDPAGANDPLVVSVFSQGTHGSVSLNANGSLRYLPFANYSGTDSFSYTISDGDGGFATATVNVTIAAVADAPGLSVSTPGGTEGSAIPITITPTLLDLDGSETLTAVHIKGVPVGAFFNHGSIITFEGTDIWMIEPGDLADLTLTVPDGPTQFTLTITAYSREGSNLSTAETSLPLTVLVSNVNPTATFNAPASSNEGSAVTVNFKDAFDPSPIDTAAGLTYRFALTSSGLDTASAGSSPSASFTFAQNGTYTIYGQVSDKDGGYTNYERTVVVNNVAPSGLTLTPSATMIHENGSVSLTGGFEDPGSLDLHDLTINWGDGSATETVHLGGGVTTFGGLTHTYLDNRPADAPFTITARVTDQDGASTTQTSPLVVQNLAPVPTITSIGSVRLEGTTIAVEGTATDPGTLDTLTYAWAGYKGTSLTAFATGAGSSWSFTPDDDGSYRIVLTVTDKDGASTEASEIINVANVAPTAALANNGPISEGHSATVTFSTGSDPSPVDLASGLRYSFALMASGLPGTYAGASTNPSSSFAFDDDGFYTVYGRVFDKDGGSTTYSTIVQVTNTDPIATGLAGAAALDEGQTKAYELAGVTDASTADASNLHYSFALSEAGLDSTYAAAGSTNAFSHLFADNGTYTVYGRVLDKDGGASTYSLVVTVANVAPTPSIVSIGSTRLEGTAIAVTGSATDPAGANDTLTYAWQVFKGGVAYASGSGVSQTGFSFTPDDNGSYQIVLTVSDEDGGSTAVNQTITVANVAPTVAIAGSAAGAQGVGLSFQSVGVQDPSPLDTAAGFTYAWQVSRDGTPVNLAGIATNGPNLAFIPTESGTYRITLTATDKDGGATTAQRMVEVAGTSGITLLPGGRLVIVGTDGADDIKVNPGGGAAEIKVKLNGIQQTFLGVTSIVIYANAGDDDVQVVGGLRLPAIVYGGAGNDSIKGGAGDDILIGGDGNDLIVGGAGRDLIVGGFGADRIVGDAGDDILIAGSSIFDANDAALALILAEWTSARTYAQRVANLWGDATSSTFSQRANGGIFLAVEGSYGRARTVVDDLVVDVLTGSDGTDWFFVNLDGDGDDRKKDKVTDLSAAEYVDDLDFINNNV